MSKILAFFLIVMSISMTFAQSNESCLPRGSRCVGVSAKCCKPTNCMFYSNSCVGDGLIIPDDVDINKAPVVEEQQPQTCLPRGSKCVGESSPCCKPSTCMFYANRCTN